MTIYKTRSHPPLPSLFSRVYIKTKKIPYLYIYIMYNSLPRGGTMLVLYIIILQKDNTHSICTQI